MERLSSTLFWPRPIASSLSLRGDKLSNNKLLYSGRSTDSNISSNKSRLSLPVLISTEEKDNITKIKPVFKNLLENVSNFVSHNGSTPSIRNKMEGVLTDVDRYFTGFYNQLNKSGGTTISVAKLQSQGNLTPMIKNTAMPFIKTWSQFVIVLKEIQQTGLDLISNSIDDNFNFILNSLDNVLKGEGYNSGIHDPVVKKIKRFQQMIWTFQGQIGKFILMTQTQKLSSEEKISQDLKSFSRDLSATFSTDFANYARNFPENERARNNAYNSVADIISMLRATILYDEDIKKINNSLEPLIPTFEIIAENLNLKDIMRGEERENKRQKKMKMKKENSNNQQNRNLDIGNEKSRDESDNYFSKDIDVNDLIDRGFIVFKRPNLTSDRVKEFFDALRSSVGKILDAKAELEKMIADKDQQLQFSESFKERLMQETQKVATLRASLSSSQDKLKSLEEELRSEQEKGNVDGLRKCLKQVLCYFRSKKEENSDTSENEGKIDALNEKEFLQNLDMPNRSSDNNLIDNVTNLMNDPKVTTCKKCQEFDNFYFKLSRILGSSTVLEEAQALVKRANASAKAEGKLQQEIVELRKEKADLVGSIGKILDIFGVTTPSATLISEFAVQSVGEQINLLNSKLKRQEDYRRRERELISKRISDMFVVKLQDNIYSQLDDVKAKFAFHETTIDQYKNTLEEAETRLVLFLGTKKSGRPIVESIKSLLTELETRQNPLQGTVDTLKREIMESTEAFVDCERTMARITREKLHDNSNMRLDQRIQKLAKSLRTIE